MAKAGTRIGTVRLNRVLPTPFCRPDGPTYNFRRYLAVEKTLFRNVDCVSFYIDDIEDGILFYSKQLGLQLLWRTANACGLGMREGHTEVLLVTERNPVVQFRVDSVEAALPHFLASGGILECGPFDIDIGKCAVVKDKWANTYCLLDMTKGAYQTDEYGNVIGLQ